MLNLTPSHISAASRGLLVARGALRPLLLAQTITFGVAPGIALASSGTASATASSGLVVSLTSQTPAVCTVAANNSPAMVRALTLGTCTLAANQSGNAQFLAAPQVLTSFAIGLRTLDVRSYVPQAASSTGFSSSIRIINTGSLTSAVTVSLIDPVTGTASTPRNLPFLMAGGSAATFSAAQIETALALPTPIAADSRPRLRVSAEQAVPIEVQSFLRNQTGVFNEVSGAQTAAAGVPINIRTFVPSASPAYVSTLRFINSGSAATSVTVARIDPTTGAVGAAGNLIASLPAGGALALGAAQIEAALGAPLTANDRPRLQVTAAGSALEVQSFLSQPVGGFAEVSSAQTGSTVDVRSFYPAGTAGLTSFVRVINAGTGATALTASLLDDATGAILGTGNLVTSLAPGAVQTFTASQIQAAVGASLPAGVTPRLRIASNGAALEVQSFLAQAGGWFTNASSAVVGTRPVVKFWIPQVDAALGVSNLRITNLANTAAEVKAALIDDNTGTTTGEAKVLIASLPAGATRSLSAAQVEAVFGIGLGNASTRRITEGSRPRLALTSNQGELAVQSFVSGPGGVMTEFSSGQ
jgi:hypothetical protein